MGFCGTKFQILLEPMLFHCPVRGAENCNITFFEVRGVKNVILQYLILREKCNITIFLVPRGIKKNVSYESSG